MLITPNTMNPIKAFRLGKGVTQSQLAKILGVTQATISHWESDHQPRPNHLRLLKSVCNFSIDDLISYYEYKRRHL